MESVSALEQNHRFTDVKSAGAFESDRRDARPALSVPTFWQRSQDASISVFLVAFNLDVPLRAGKMRGIGLDFPGVGSFPPFI